MQTYPRLLRERSLEHMHVYDLLVNDIISFNVMFRIRN